ncbi:hypothetical protein ALC62_11564 [Cyphomyrmex costatus]|uniref:Tyr recombinase domain-containing protein n=1 Tax=Cyphomyrmex costatus TaxID=456900 RepID=A0A151ICD3_9HYME|nr:hypothetical protein ALC62_11564 [Cyphomyrmex costatus]
MEQDFPGGREIIRQAFLLRGTPASALDATLASLSKHTIAQYTKPLRLWWSFCMKEKICYFAPPVSAVLEFLSACLPNTGSYSSLNTYRAAISLLTAEEIGSHPLVKRFFKGVACLKPQRPRYDFTWDPSPVVQYLASLYPHENLSLELISKKVAALLALTTAQRVQTLAAIQLSQIAVSDKVIIKISTRLKTSGIGQSQPLLIFKQFVERPELSIFSLIKFFINFTRDLCRSDCDSFFVSFRPPHKAVSSQTLSRWIKAVLGSAGVDISIFSAHSTRHASTSLAASKGISLDEIRRTAGWSETSTTFARFYNRPIINDPAFQAAILEI